MTPRPHPTTALMKPLVTLSNSHNYSGVAQIQLKPVLWPYTCLCGDITIKRVEDFDVPFDLKQFRPIKWKTIFFSLLCFILGCVSWHGSNEKKRHINELKKPVTDT